MAEEQLLLKIGINADTKGLNSLNTQFNQLQRGINTLNSSLKTGGASLDTYKAKQQLLAKQLDTLQQKQVKCTNVINNFSKAMQENRAKYEELAKAEGDHSSELMKLDNEYYKMQNAVNKAETEMATLETQIRSTTTELNNCNIAVENFNQLQLSEHLQEQGKHLQELGDKWSNAGTVITNVGTGIVKAFAPIETAGALAVKCAIDFESSWASATKTIDGTDEELQNLQDGLRGLSKEMPTNINDLNELAAAAGQMGIGVNDVKEYVRVMAMLGETTNISADEATTALAQLLNITGGNVGEISNLGSAIVDLGNNLATDEATIVEFAQRIAGVGASADMSEQDILAFSAAMGALGINAEAGGTSFSTFVSKIQLACSDGGESLQKFSQVAGMSSEEFQKAFNENSTDAIMAVVKGMHDYQESGGDLISLISNLGISETRQRDLLLRLAQGYEIVEDSLGISNEAWAENTALQNEANKRYETTASQMEMLKNKVYDVGISIGAQLLPVINDMIDKVGDAVEWFSQLDPELSANIIKFSTLATGVGLFTSVLGTMVSGIGGGISTVGKFIGWIGKLAAPAQTASVAIQGVTAATAGISTASASAGVLASLGGALSALAPVAVPVVAALAAVGGAIVAYKTNFAGFRDTCSAVTEDIGRIFNVWKENMLKIFGHIKEGWENDFMNIRTMLETGWENITTIFETVFGVIENVFDMFADGFEGDWEGVWENVFAITEELFDGFKEMWANSLDTTLTILDEIFPGLKDKLDFLPEMWNGVFDTIKTIVDEGITNIKTGFDVLANLAQGDFSGAWDVIVERWTDVWNKVTNILGTAKDWIVEKFNSMVESVKEFASNFKDGVVEKYEEVKEGVTTKVSEMVDNVVTFFSELPNKIAYGLGAAIGAIIQWGVDSYNYLTTNVPIWIESVGTWFSELPGKVKTWLDDTITKVTTWGTNMKNKAVESATNFINSCIQKLSELPGKVKAKLDEAINKVRTWASDMGNKAREAANNVITAINNGLSSLPGIAVKWGSQLPSKIWNGISSGLSSLRTKVSNMLSGLVNSAVEGFKSTFGGGGKKREHGGFINTPEISYTNEPHGGKTGFELIDGPAMALSSPSSNGTLTLLGQGARVRSNLTSTQMMLDAVKDEVQRQIANTYFDYGMSSSTLSRMAFNFGNSQQNINNNMTFDDSNLANLLITLIGAVQGQNMSPVINLNAKSIAKATAPYIDKELQWRARKR